MITYRVCQGVGVTTCHDRVVSMWNRGMVRRVSVCRNDVGDKGVALGDGHSRNVPS